MSVEQRGYVHVYNYDIVAACGTRGLQIVPIQNDSDWGVGDTAEALGEEVDLAEVSACQFTVRL